MHAFDQRPLRPDDTSARATGEDDEAIVGPRRKLAAQAGQRVESAAEERDRERRGRAIREEISLQLRDASFSGSRHEVELPSILGKQGEHIPQARLEQRIAPAPDIADRQGEVQAAIPVEMGAIGGWRTARRAAISEVGG